VSRSRLGKEILLNRGARFHYVHENALDEGTRLPLIWETLSMCSRMIKRESSLPRSDRNENNDSSAIDLAIGILVDTARFPNLGSNVALSGPPMNMKAHRERASILSVT
jgi:hypothetical protein